MLLPLCIHKIVAVFAQTFMHLVQYFLDHVQLISVVTVIQEHLCVSFIRKKLNSICDSLTAFNSFLR